MKKIGIEPGKSFDVSKLDPAIQKALGSVPEEAQELMKWKVPTLARVVNGWSLNTDTMGVYGNYYLKRAIVAQLGPRRQPTRGCDLSAEPRRTRAASRSTARNKYKIHFEKEQPRP